LWQWVIAAHVLGILMIRFPVPAAVAALAAGTYFAASRPRPLAWALAGLGLVAGFAHGNLRLPEPPAALPGIVTARHKVALSGIVDEVLAKPGGRLEIRLTGAAWKRNGQGGELPGLVAWVWDKPVSRPMPGDRVRLDPVRIKTVRGFVNPGTWSYSFYRRLQGVFYRTYTRGGGTAVAIESTGRGPLDGLRERLRQAMARHLPQDGPGQGMPAALVMGERFGLAPETVELFRRASLAHSLALSGMHLGFVAALGFGLAWLAGAIRPEVYLRIPRLKLGVILAAPLVLTYVWLGGATPSLVRSAVMFASFGLMLMLGRGRVLVDGLFAALAVIVAISPLSVFDIRLQFSAAAVAGIGVFMPHIWRHGVDAFSRMRNALRRPGPKKSASLWERGLRRLFQGASACLLVSLCANLALLPLVIWNFGVISPNLLPNLFWLPVMGLAVLPLSLLGMVLAVVPFFDPLAGVLLGVAASLCDWSVGVLQAADGLGLLREAASLRPDWPLVLGYYMLLVGVAVVLGGGRRLGALGLAVGIVLAFVPGMVREWPWSQRGLSIAALDTGQSQSLALAFPDGTRALVDGGGTWSDTFDIGRGVVSPALTANRPPALDYVVMTHPDMDHSKGLVFPLGHYSVGRFAYNGQMPEGGIAARLDRALQEQSLEPEVWRTGDEIMLGQGVVMQVLHPPAGFAASGTNDHSLVLRITWRGQGMALLPGDLEGPGLRELMASGADLSARLLVLPHHGGRSGVTGELLELVRPELALACAGHLNYRRLPHEDVRAALDMAGVPLLVTGENGGVLVKWAGPDAPLEVQTALP